MGFPCLLFPDFAKCNAEVDMDKSLTETIGCGCYLPSRLAIQNSEPNCSSLFETQ
jgi:hypothetical protein